MPYRAAKISFDGSHYIATPKENFPQGHKRRRAVCPLSGEEIRLSLSVRDFNCDIISRLSLRQSRKTCLAFPLSRYHSVRFPMTEFFAAVHAFIPFADAFPRREPSSVAHAFTGFPFST